jgi:Fe-S-cluster containining protein
MKMQRAMDDWRQNAEDHRSANLAFLDTLDLRNDKAIDRTARRLHREAFAIINCTRCANCCKTMVPVFSEDEAERVADYLNMKRQELLESYLAPSAADGRWRPGERPCPFLDSDDRCMIYEVRPASCEDFPHTHRADFAAWSSFHCENSLFCPAVFYVIEQMKGRGVK